MNILTFLIQLFAIRLSLTIEGGTPSCTLCVVKTYRDTHVTDTLVFYANFQCPSSKVTQCIHKNVTYKMCWEENDPRPTCFDPKTDSVRIRVNIYGYMGEKGGIPITDHSQLLATAVTTKIDQSLTICFDVCRVLTRTGGDKELCGNLNWEKAYTFENLYVYLCDNGPCQYWYAWNSGVVVKGPPYYAGQDHWFQIQAPRTSPDCASGQCNPMCLLFDSEALSGRDKRKSIGVGIDGHGKDPYGTIVVETVNYHPPPTEYRIHTTFWKYMDQEIEIPAAAKNLFIDLAERIAGELRVQSCYVCGGTNMGEQWPWESKEISLTNLPPSIKITWNSVKRPTRWVLTNILVGKICFIRLETFPFVTPVGELDCEAGWVCNGTSQPEYIVFSNNSHVPPKGKRMDSRLKQLWEDPCNPAIQWKAPDSLYWICGNLAYSELKNDWAGACVLGAIRPSFFLVPLQEGEKLGIPVYRTLGRIKRDYSSKIAQVKIGNWQDQEWPPERILQVYGPATWNQDGMWGYRTPIYLLNRLIRLQAVLEIITNETTVSLNMLAKTNYQLRTAVYQNRLALDYLLAAEGGVCGKFNFSACCLQIGDNRKVIEQLGDDMRNLAHVPVQTWTGVLQTGGWFTHLFQDWKRILVLVGLVCLSIFLLPILIPVMRCMVARAVKAVTARHDPRSARIMYLSAAERVSVYEGLRRSRL